MAQAAAIAAAITNAMRAERIGVGEFRGWTLEAVRYQGQAIGVLYSGGRARRPVAVCPWDAPSSTLTIGLDAMLSIRLPAAVLDGLEAQVAEEAAPVSSGVRSARPAVITSRRAFVAVSAGGAA